MSSNRIFTRYPALYFVAAGIIIANNLIQFAPAQVLKGNMGFIIPGIFIALGTVGLIMKAKEKKDSAEINE